jgi:hypothetical protein
MPAPQFRYFLLTIPHHHFTPYLPNGVSWIKGQLEQGEGGYLHWQVCVAFPKKVTLSKLKDIFGQEVHAEGTRSTAAEDYVWKDDSCIGHRFELGQKSIRRNSDKDWDAVLTSAKRGRWEDIPADILIRCYGNLKKIHVDSLVPEEQVREVFVFWGETGAGKSRRAWDEASFDAYPKDPNSKFWDGYRGQENIVIDEFRGAISISHMLRWLDRYPTIVEVKGSSVVFKAKRIWITSNISPDDWYPTLDSETKAALRRRFTSVIHFVSLQ